MSKQQKQHDMVCIKSSPYVTRALYSKWRNPMTSDTVKMYVLCSFLSCSLWQRCILSAGCSSVFFSTWSYFLCFQILHLDSSTVFQEGVSHLELKMGSYCKGQLVVHANIILTKDVCVLMQSADSMQSKLRYYWHTTLCWTVGIVCSLMIKFCGKMQIIGWFMHLSLIYH